ncbi:unnamed protein product [Schistocephalus solidus]|uniref:WD_REPEATS_REGION domain-containing protein n=1 Tax=Schistocephalus solidus TaxID=70667 RepID=A0A183T8S6_SCHSO|nr:unnamed protein product [Schistocephalus solidus]
MIALHFAHLIAPEMTASIHLSPISLLHQYLRVGSLLSVTLPSEETAGCNAQFRQLGDICRYFAPAVVQPSSPPRSCILDAVVLRCDYETRDNRLSSIHLAYSNTAGLVRACFLPLPDVSAVAELCCLKMTIIGSSSCCSANALACLPQPQSLLAACGDDGSVRLVCWPKARTASAWACTVRQHYAAVVRAVLVPNSGNDSECFLFSLGSDQRLLLWKVYCNDGISLLVCSALTLAGLGDPHGLAVCCFPILSADRPKRYCILVVGSGVEVVIARPIGREEVAELTNIQVLELTD